MPETREDDFYRSYQTTTQPQETALTEAEDKLLAEAFNTIDEQRLAQEKVSEYLEKIIPIFAKRYGEDSFKIDKTEDGVDFYFIIKKNNLVKENIKVRLSDNFLVEIESHNGMSNVIQAIISDTKDVVLTAHVNGLVMGEDSVGYTSSSHSYRSSMYPHSNQTALSVPVKKALPVVKKLIGLIGHVRGLSPSPKAIAKSRAAL